MSNAIQAIDKKGAIEIITHIKDNMLSVSIKDNGCGIKEEHLSRIFDPFFTTKEAGSGTGLGLSISYGIIKECKGSIQYKSRVGIGTEAIISLPML